MEERTCRICKKTKHITEYYKDRNNYKRTCKKCFNEKRYGKNSKKIKTRTRRENLTETEILSIQQKSEEGLSSVQIAKDLNISNSCTVRRHIRKYEKHSASKEYETSADKLRIELYEALRIEYMETEMKLKKIHKKMTLIGEQW